MTVFAGLSRHRFFSSVPPVVYFLIALIIALGLLEPRFLGLENVGNVLRNATILAFASFGQAIIVLTGGIDLSTGSTVALVSVVMASVASNFGLAASFEAGIVVAVLVGAVNGVLVGRFDLPPFLATLGMLSVAVGLASYLVGGLPLAGPGGGFTVLGTGMIGPIPISIVVALIGYLVLELLLRRTVLGRSWYLVGSSRAAALAAGIRVRWTLFAAYLVAGLFVAIAGLILTSQVDSGNPDLDPTLAFEAIAACAIGGLPLTGGAGSAGQVVAGVLVLAVVENGLLLLNLSSSAQIATTGVLTVAAVLGQGPTLERIRSSRSSRRGPR